MDIDDSLRLQNSMAYDIRRFHLPGFAQELLILLQCVQVSRMPPTKLPVHGTRSILQMLARFRYIAGLPIRVAQ